MKNNGAVVIPARLKSSRFPGKPLAKINGKMMIHHVYDRCVKAVGKRLVYVATDDSVISKAVKNFGGNVIMTSPDCLTGTDRLAEANMQLDYDFLVNVQGDEPMINPESIRTIFDAMMHNTSKY